MPNPTPVRSAAILSSEAGAQVSYVAVEKLLGHLFMENCGRFIVCFGDCDVVSRCRWGLSSSSSSSSSSSLLSSSVGVLLWSLWLLSLSTNTIYYVPHSLGEEDDVSSNRCRAGAKNRRGGVHPQKNLQMMVFTISSRVLMVYSWGYVYIYIYAWPTYPTTMWYLEKNEYESVWKWHLPSKWLFWRYHDDKTKDVGVPKFWRSHI